VNLAVLDMDGTLLNNLAEEDACYARASREELSLVAMSGARTLLARGGRHRHRRGLYGSCGHAGRLQHRACAHRVST